MRSLILHLIGSLSLTLANNWHPSDPCPTAIDQTVPGGPNATFPTMASIHAAMLTCPDIAILKVRVNTMMGCRTFPDRYNFPFDLLGGERYASAPLVLSLDGYRPDESEWDRLGEVANPVFYDNLADWVLSSNVWQWVRCRFLSRSQRSKTNLDLWLDAMDFSRIHTLQLNRTQGAYMYALTEQVAQKLPPKLTNLESLAVYGFKAEQFILALPKSALKHLSWKNPWGSGKACFYEPRALLEPLLQHHGSSLESLDYHTDESVTCPPLALSIDELHQLVSLAPKLSSLTIDLGRESNGTGSDLHWPWEKLQLLAEGLPELTDLTIYFELAAECTRYGGPNYSFDDWYFDNQPFEPCLGPDRFAHPLLDEGSAMDMTRFLLQHTSSQRLRTVSFRAGDWEAVWDDGPFYHRPLYRVPWLKDKRAWATCVLDNSTSNGEKTEPFSGQVACDAGHSSRLDEDDKPQYLCETPRKCQG